MKLFFKFNIVLDIFIVYHIITPLVLRTYKIDPVDIIMKTIMILVIENKTQYHKDVNHNEYFLFLMYNLDTYKDVLNEMLTIPIIFKIQLMLFEINEQFQVNLFVMKVIL